MVTFIAARNHAVAESFGFRLVAKVDLLEEHYWTGDNGTNDS
jgi:hypothetical protein